MLKKLALTVAFATFAACNGYAAAPASDNAADPVYDDAWTTGDNGGIGFDPWALTSAGAGGHYVGATALDAESFGVFSGGGAGNSGSADRGFAGGSLLSGESFTLNLAVTGVSSTGPGVVGLNLLASGSPVFTFKFTGGETFWELNDGASDFQTNIPFAANTPISFNFLYNGGNSYDVTITQGGDTYFGNDFTSTSNISNVSGFRVFSNAQGAGENVGFDNPAVVPEPSSLSLLAGPAILGAWFFVRRRRA